MACFPCIKCNKCRKLIPKIDIVCSQCGADMPPGVPSCPKCGCTKRKFIKGSVPDPDWQGTAEFREPSSSDSSR